MSDWPQTDDFDESPEHVDLLRQFRKGLKPGQVVPPEPQWVTQLPDGQLPVPTPRDYSEAEAERIREFARIFADTVVVLPPERKEDRVAGLLDPDKE